MLFTNLRKRKLFTKSIFSQSLQPFTFQMSKTICNTKFIVDFQGQIGQKGQKGHLFSPVFFPLGARGDLACKSCASSQETSHD